MVGLCWRRSLSLELINFSLAIDFLKKILSYIDVLQQHLFIVSRPCMLQIDLSFTLQKCGGFCFSAMTQNPETMPVCQTNKIKYHACSLSGGCLYPIAIVSTIVQHWTWTGVLYYQGFFWVVPMDLDPFMFLCLRRAIDRKARFRTGEMGGSRSDFWKTSYDKIYKQYAARACFQGSFLSSDICPFASCFRGKVLCLCCFLCSPWIQQAFHSQR